MTQPPHPPRPRRVARRVALAAGALALCAWAAAASAKGNGGTLVVGEDQAPIHLNPLFADDMYTIRAVELIFDSLVGYNSANQAIAPRLAKSWKLEGDRIAFTLQTGVNWQDGQPFSAQDVVFTVDAMLATHPWFKTIVESASSAAPDEVTLKLRQPGVDVESVLEELTFKILPRHKFPAGRKKIRYDDPFNQAPVGTGPFRFDRRMDKEFIYEANGDHKPDPPLLDRIKIHVFPAKALQVEALRTGLLGLLVSVRPKDVPVLRGARKTIRVFESTPLNWWYLAYNFDHPVVRDLALREAITYALDREQLRAAHLGEGATISGPFADTDLRNPKAVEPRPHDVAKARALLEAAGYSYEGKTLTKGGKPVKLTMLAQPPLGAIEGLFTDLTSQLAAIGIEIEVKKPADLAAHRAELGGDGYDLVLGRLRPTPGEYLRSLFHSKVSGNRYHYANPAIDQLLDALHQSPDPVVRQRLIRKLHVELARDLPYTFLWSVKGYSAYRSDRYEGVEYIHPHYFFSQVTRWDSVKGASR